MLALLSLPMVRRMRDNRLNFARASPRSPICLLPECSLLLARADPNFVPVACPAVSQRVSQSSLRAEGNASYAGDGWID